MAKEFFKNSPDTSTPLSAGRLNGLLNGTEAMGNILVGDVKCKNLFNTSLTTGNWNTDGTTTTTSNFVRTSGYIEVEPNTTYTLSSENNSISSFVGNLHFRNKNKEFISQIYEFNTFTTPENCYFITFHGSNTVYNLSLNIQLEEGTSVTDYTPNKAFGIESGSNSNGSWIKFEDGTLIQYVTKNIPFTFTSYNKWGVMWESDLTDLGKFPIDFVDTPDTINITNYSSSGGFIESLQNTTNSQIGKMYICRPSDTNGVFNYYLSIIAIGRWK